MVRSNHGLERSSSLLVACDGTRTGNPNLPEGPRPRCSRRRSLIRSALSPNRESRGLRRGARALGADNQAFAFRSVPRGRGRAGQTVLLALQHLGRARDDVRRGRARHRAANRQRRCTSPCRNPSCTRPSTSRTSCSTRVRAGRDRGRATRRAQLSTINASFAERTLTVKEPFLDTLALYYGAGVYHADFRPACRKSRGSTSTTG